MTHTETDALTPEEVHDRLLNVMRWRQVKPEDILWENPEGKWILKPHLDDNLMREARKLLDTNEKKRRFINYLVGDGMFPITGPSMVNFLDRPALDQARAFLKTMEGME